MTPILRLALAWAAGDLLGLLWPDPRAAPGVASLGAGLALMLAALAGRFSRWMVAAFVLAGLGVGVLHAERARSDCRATLPDGGRVALTGVFDGVIAPDTAGRLRIETVSVGGSEVACRGAVRVRVPQRAFKALPDGRHVRVSGRWWSSPRGRWPEPAERRGTLSADSVRALSGPDMRQRASGWHGHPLVLLRTAAQRRIREQFGDRAGLAEALLLARREALDEDVRRRFVEAGLAHLLAISGAHVGIIAAVLLMLARMAGMSVRAGSACAASVTVAYILFLGAPWAAARAGLQAVLVLLTRWLQRPADPLGMLAVAAVALLAADGLALLDIGFQLSFAGMYGIIAWREPVREWFRERVAWAPAGALATTLAATFATAPVAAFHFGTVSTIGPVANLVAGPLVALCIPAVALSMVVGWVSAAVGALLASGTQPLLALLDRTAAAASVVPWSHTMVSSRVVTAWLIACLAFVASARWARGTAGHRAEAAGTSPARLQLLLRASIAVTAWSVLPLVAGRGSGWLEIHAIDVGQGDAIAIRSPGGRWLLVDTGPASDRFDAGRSIIVPFLLRHGVDHIDALILTHPDADHIGGAAAVLDAIDVSVVIDPAVATGKDLFLSLLQAASVRRIPWIEGRAGREIAVDGVTLRFLAPAAGSLDASADANDYSLVFRLEHGRFSALFTGDAPRAVENDIVARSGTGLQSTVLKVGHHGSRTSTGDSVLAAVRPRIALLSVGRRNRYGHPDPEVMARLVQSGVRVLRTDQSGTLQIRARADGRVQLATTR